MDKETVILVDENDVQTGTAEKQQAHIEGLLHRAFSVFVFNNTGELLLQQRARHKYHSPLLWSNTCCSHPRPGETTLAAATRRCREEMGIGVVLEPAFAFTYRVALDQGLTEHEYDHVFIGQYEQDPHINPEEVKDFRWTSLKQLQKDIVHYPARYTTWLQICLDKLVDHYQQKHER